jgi:hypothetical protein
MGTGEELDLMAGFAPALRRCEMVAIWAEVRWGW